MRSLRTDRRGLSALTWLEVFAILVALVAIVDYELSTAPVIGSVIPPDEGYLVLVVVILVVIVCAWRALNWVSYWN